jgi:TonB family protein
VPDQETASLPQEELVVERPEPEPPVEAEPLPAPPEETKDPEPEPPVEDPEPEPRRDPPPTTEPEPTTAPPSEERAEEGGADVNVRLEGLRRDYPAYYNSIILEIRKCFRPPAGNARAVVYFVIRRDGTVSDARLVERSGNAAFDYAALGAVECAGGGRFGPLPDDLPYERLPIQFTFEPQRLGGGPDDGIVLFDPFRQRP